MKTIYVVFQDIVSDSPIICGIYANKDAAKECIAAAKNRWMVDHKLQTKYGFADGDFLREEYDIDEGLATQAWLRS
jgi:hypothetical protein